MCADTLTLRVEKLSSNGEGIAFSEGKAVFLPFAIPGETALAEIIEEHSSFSRARLIDIEESSPYRVEPFALILATAADVLFSILGMNTKHCSKTSGSRDLYPYRRL